MLSVEIFQVLASDISSICVLWGANAVETANVNLQKEDIHNISNMLQAYIQSDDAVLLKYTDISGELVGYCLATLYEDKSSGNSFIVGCIEELYVTPCFRRQGVARHFVENVNNWFQHKNVVRTIVNVDPENIIAQNFWEGIGAEREYFQYTFYE